MLFIAKWLFIPYLLCVLYAMIVGKAVGNSLLEEYLVIMAFLIIIDIQRLLIYYLHK